MVSTWSINDESIPLCILKSFRDSDTQSKIGQFSRTRHGKLPDFRTTAHTAWIIEFPPGPSTKLTALNLCRHRQPDRNPIICGSFWPNNSLSDYISLVRFFAESI